MSNGAKWYLEYKGEFEFALLLSPGKICDLLYAVEWEFPAPREVMVDSHPYVIAANKWLQERFLPVHGSLDDTEIACINLYLSERQIVRC